MEEESHKMTPPVSVSPNNQADTASLNTVLGTQEEFVD